MGGQDLKHFRTSLDVARLLIKAWLRAAAEQPEVLPVSVAVPIDSGAVLGVPYVFQAHEPWCYRLECSHGEVHRFVDDARQMLGVSLRTFIHENMYGDLQEEKLTAVKDLGCRILSALEDQALSHSEALTSPTPQLAELIKTLLATTTDAAWKRAFSSPTKELRHALLMSDA
jgi:hypothetical protein